MAKQNDLIEIVYNPQFKYKGYFLDIVKNCEDSYTIKMKDFITGRIDYHNISKNTEVKVIGRVKNSIYLITCLINGKQYIGRTSTTVEQRFRSHISESRKYPITPLHIDIKKYGEDNFKVETLFEYYADRQKEANKTEQEFIRKYNTAYPNGYDLSVF